jgi:hypothetical protein
MDEKIEVIRELKIVIKKIERRILRDELTLKLGLSRSKENEDEMESLYVELDELLKKL